MIFNNELSGSQIKNISDLVGVKVIDRTMLILDIFAMRATSNEGKLQVALAQYKYTLPRLSGIAGSSGRFGSGGVGMRGPGETKLELDRRVIQNNITRLEKQIKELKENRNLRRSERTKIRLKKSRLLAIQTQEKAHCSTQFQKRVYMLMTNCSQRLKQQRENFGSMLEKKS